MAVKVKVELDDQEARQDLKELESEKHKIKLDIEGSYEDILKDIQKLQKRLEQKGLKLKLDLGDINKALKESSASGSLNKFGSEMAKELISQFNVADKEVQSKIQTISQELSNLYSNKFTSADGSYDIDSVSTKIMELGDIITNNANIIQQKLGIYDEFYNYLKKIGSIKISEQIRSDLGDEWGTLRSLYPSKFTTGKGIELDSIYQELSTKFPDIFKGQSNPTEQFRELCQAIQNYRADVAKIEPVDAKTLGLDDSVYQSIIASVEKLNALYQQSNTKASAQESAKEIQNEASAMDKVEESATTAASKKEKFADANKKVEQSAENTTDAVQAEADAMMDMSNLDSILAGVNMQGQQGNSVFQRFGNTLRETFIAYTGFNLLQDTVHEVTRAGKEAVDTVKELNDLKTDLQMVTGDSSDKVGVLINDYNDLAQELGATTKAVGESADAFLRQGRTMQETNQLIQDSMVLSKVAKIDAEESAEILTATINGFKMAASEASHVNDVLSAVDLTSASDAGGIGEALTKVASQANNASISLEKTVAMLATMKDVTQDTDSTIGVALKTILSRMNQIRAGKFVDAETGEAFNDVEKVLNKIGISIRDANNQLLGSETILDTIAEKWQSIDKNTVNAVSTAFAGTHQANKFISLMDNWDKVRKLTDIAMNSDGSAESKFEVYLDSLEAKTQALQASLESLASDTIPDDLYASVLDTAKAMIDAADSSGILKSALTGLGTVGAIYTFQHLASYLGEAAQGFSDLGTAMIMTKNTIADVSDMQRLLDLTQGLSQSQTRLILSTNTLTDAQKIAILMNQNMSEAEATATLQAWNLSAAQQGATASTMTLSGVLKGLYATMAANPLILVGLAVTAGVTLWQKYKQSLEEVDKKAEESKQKFDELSSEINDLNSELETTKKRIDELANKDVSLTLVEQDELDRLRAQNDELEREIELKKYAAQMEGKRAATEAVSAINKKTESYIEYYTAEDGNTYNAERHESRIDAMQRQIALAEQLKQEQDELIQKQKELEDSYRDANGVLNYEALTKDSAYDYYNNQMDTLGSRIEYAEGKMADYYNDLSSLDDALYDDYGNIISGAEETADKLNSVYEAYLQYGRGGKTVVQNLSDYFDSVDNQAVVQKLDDAYAQYANGDISDATLKSMTEYAEVMDATGISAEGLTTHLKDLYEAKQNLADTTVNIGIVEPVSYEESLSKVKGLSKGLKDILDEIYADVLNKEDFDWSTILNNDDFTETFGNMENVTEEYKTVYDDFIRTVSNNSKDIDACQDSFDRLATAYIQNSGALNNLTEETKQATITMLEEMGIENAEEVVTATLARNKEELALQNTLLSNTTSDLSSVTAAEIQSLMDEGTISQDTAQKMAGYALEKQLCNVNTINTAADCQNIIRLAQVAGAGVEALQKLEALKQRLAENPIMADSMRANITSKIKEIVGEVNASMNVTVDVPQAVYKGATATKKAQEDATKSASDTASDIKDQIEAYMNYLEKSLDSGKIDYQTYCNTVKNYLDDMHKSGKISAKDYFDYIEKALEKQKSVLDKVLSAVVKRFEKEMDRIQEKIDSLESENDLLNSNLSNMDSALNAVDKVYDTEIDRIQAIIDGLKDANDERDRALALEKAKYQLEKAYNNRIIKQYIDGKGYVYSADFEAIRDAQKSYDDAELDLKTSELSKQVSELEKFKAQWDSVKDAYQDNIDSMNAIALLGSEYQKLILNNNILDIENFKNQYVGIQQQINSNEELIKSYEEKKNYYDKLKSEWSALSDEYENKQNEMLASQVLGANWENDVLNGRLSTLDGFRTQYISVQQAIADAQWQSANEQIKALQALADAAWASANEQINAAKEAQKAASGSTGSAGSVGSAYNVSGMISAGAPTSVINKITGNKSNTSAAATTDQRKNNSHIIMSNEQKKTIAASKKRANNIRKYANGGVVSVNPDDLFSDIAKHNGEDGFIVASNGERVLTERQNVSFEKFVDLITGMNITPQMLMPDFMKAAQTVTNNNRPNYSVNMGEIHLHGVQNVDEFSKEIVKRMPGVMFQSMTGNRR